MVSGRRALENAKHHSFDALGISAALAVVVSHAVAAPA
jgi:hypothetical protein